MQVKYVTFSFYYATYDIIYLSSLDCLWRANAVKRNRSIVHVGKKLLMGYGVQCMN